MPPQVKIDQASSNLANEKFTIPCLLSWHRKSFCK